MAEVKNNISKFSNCYDCGVCVAVCPKKIIDFKENRDGFFSPKISHSDDCIECEMCLKVCAFDHEIQYQNSDYEYYAGWSKNTEKRLISSSGGIAYEIAKRGVENGYKVIGVKYNISTCRAEYFVAEKVEDIDRMQGSKYVQSFTPNSLNAIFDGSKYVVFGLPCYIHSLRNWLRIRKVEYKFILVDFFCHGIPSYLMWDKYMKDLAEITGTVEAVKWRNKSNGGWHNSWNMILQGQKGTFCCSLKENDIFYKFFLKNRCLNAACYDSCKYKMCNSAADIRLGDLWSAKYSADNKGVSGIVALTSVGKDVLAELSSSCTIMTEKSDIVMEAQMKTCAKRPSSYLYVKKKLRSEMTLGEIDRYASRKELFHDKIPFMMKYYLKRIPEKLFKK